MLTNKLHVKYVLFGQLLFDIGVFCFSGSYFCLTFSLVITAWTTAVCYLHQKNKKIQNNLFYPNSLLNKTGQTIVVLTFFSILPVVVGCLEEYYKERFCYDNSFENILSHLLSNLLGLLAGIAIIYLVKQTKGAKEYIMTGFKNQDLISIILLNASLLSSLLFGKQEIDLKPLHSARRNLHVWFNDLWLIIIVYLSMASLVFLYHYIYASKNKGKRILLTKEILIFSQMIYFFFFFLGMFNQVDSLTYNMFVSATPVVIFGNWILLSGLSHQLSDRRYGVYARQNAYADIIDSRFIFTVVNLLVYVSIISYKTGFYYMVFPQVLGIGTLVCVFFINFTRTHSLLSRTEKLLNHLTNLGDTEDVVATKLFLYHHLKEMKRLDMIQDDGNNAENTQERFVQEHFQKELARLEKQYYK